MRRLAIYGAGGFGQEVHAIALEHVAARLPDVEIVFIDDALAGAEILGTRVVAFSQLSPGDLYTLAISDGKARARLAAECDAAGLKAETIFATMIRKGPLISAGEGSIFCDFTSATVNARIGRHFQCNSYSYVAHDCIVGDFVTFGPRVSCNGNVRIGDHVYIGTGAVIRNGRPGHPLMIGEGAIIGMGAVVTKDVPAGVTVVGNPARVLMPVASQEHVADQVAQPRLLGAGH